MMGLFLNAGPVYNYTTAAKSDSAGFATFFNALLNSGVSIAPSPFESLFVSSVHTTDILNSAKTAFEQAFSALKGQKNE
jgi:glutamate-1-semialdehyde 2,1-aminomutase